MRDATRMRRVALGVPAAFAGAGGGGLLAHVARGCARAPVTPVALPKRDDTYYARELAALMAPRTVKGDSGSAPARRGRTLRPPSINQRQGLGHREAAGGHAYVDELHCIADTTQQRVDDSGVPCSTIRGSACPEL